ncbi:MAG: ABC transporter permease [Treponema sp.]|nr:ABC transporter permease [Treponema sp.]
MKIKASLLFALRLLFPRTGKKSNARRSLVGACVCIGISLVPLVMVLTVSNGMIQGITNRVIGLSSSHINCILYPFAETAKSETSLRTLAESLRKADGVKNSYPEIQGVGLAAGKMGRTGATIRAVEKNIFTDNAAFAELFEVVSGEPSLQSKNSAIIGKKLAETLQISAGDTFRLITARRLESGKLVPKLTSMKVSAVVSSGYQELDALWVFIPLSTGFSIMPVQSSEVHIAIETADAFDFVRLGQVQGQINRMVPQYTRVYLWNELNTAQFENFSSTQIMLLFIMLLIVLVASVNISSALVMLVMERRKEIAILKSLGGSAEGISFAFLVTGLVTGVFGVIGGIPAGLLCAVNFDTIINLIEKAVNSMAMVAYILASGSTADFTQIHLLDPAFYLQKIPLAIPLGQLIIIGCGTLVLSLLVSAIPAIRAGREKPIDTLRKI